MARKITTASWQKRNPKILIKVKKNIYYHKYFNKFYIRMNNDFYVVKSDKRLRKLLKKGVKRNAD